MSEIRNKNVTVRTQKTKKSHIKQKLIFFFMLAAALVILAVFQTISVPMIHMLRIFPVRYSHPAYNIPWEQILMEGICFPG